MRTYKSSAHKEVEELAARCHAEDAEKMMKDFDEWMIEAKRKYPMVWFHHYTIAEYCLAIENERACRVDVLSIKSEKKVK